MPTLVKKYSAIHPGVLESSQAYEAICSTISPQDKRQWLKDEATAQKNRWQDKTFMDIYDVHADKGIP